MMNHLSNLFGRGPLSINPLIFSGTDNFFNNPFISEIVSWLDTISSSSLRRRDSKRLMS